MKRETPGFPPPCSNPLHLPTAGSAFRTAAPLSRSRTFGWTDGRTDGRTAQAPPGPVQGCRQGGQEGIWGSALGAPCPRPGRGPLWPPPGRLFGDSFLFLVPPCPLARCGGCSCRMDADGCWDALAPTRLWQCHQQGSEMPSPATAPPALRPPPIPAAAAERRGGGRLRRGPHPCRPRFAPGPRLGRGAGAAFSLSSQPEAEGLFNFFFYLINFHFLHKTSNCKYF